MRSLVFVAAMLMSCTTTINASHYARTCSADDECVPVFSGDVCAVCGGCATTAINRSAETRYASDVRTIRDLCPPRLGPVPACAPCPQAATVCRAGACELAGNTP